MKIEFDNDQLFFIFVFGVVIAIIVCVVLLNTHIEIGNIPVK
jgi:hypothetical protein